MSEAESVGTSCDCYEQFVKSHVLFVQRWPWFDVMETSMEITSKSVARQYIIS